MWRLAQLLLASVLRSLCLLLLVLPRLLLWLLTHCLIVCLLLLPLVRLMRLRLLLIPPAALHKNRVSCTKRRH